MVIAHEIPDVELGGWPAGTQFYGVDDGRFFVIVADLADYSNDGNVSVVRQPTVLLYTNAAAWPTDLTPDFTADPGTPHEDAVAAAGFTLGGGDA